MEENSQKNRDIPDVLYIAGYGRSGSTVLDILLGSHERSVSVGELTYLGREWMHEERSCACGADYKKCVFWRDALRDTEEARHLARITRQVEHRRSLPRLLTGTLPDQVQSEYRRYMRHLFAYVSKRADADWVVDSSKSARHAAGRFWALRNIAGLDVRILHLVRDGRGVLNSVVEKGTNWAVEGHKEEKSFRAGRTLIGWNLANIIAYILGNKMSKHKYSRLKLEDALENTSNFLEEVESLSGEDIFFMDKNMLSNEKVCVGHNVGGNRIRKKDGIKIKQKRKNSYDPWRNLNLIHKIMFILLGGATNRMLGYKDEMYNER